MMRRVHLIPIPFVSKLTTVDDAVAITNNNNSLIIEADLGNHLCLLGTGPFKS
jgi:hypothetical protein